MKLSKDPNVPSGSTGLDVLARFLEDIPDKKYRHESFTAGTIQTPDDLLNHCGTTASAIGFLPCIPEFLQRGWYFTKYGQVRRSSVKEEWSLSAPPGGQEEFGITSEQFGRVFGYAGYAKRGRATRTEVIAAIRKLADELREDGR